VSRVRYCRVCFLQDRHPGVTLDADGVCNVCRLDVAAEFVRNVTDAREAYREFERSAPLRRADRYDCLLMYSGGKDSTYMLDKLVNEQRIRVLAYTFSPPFESTHTTENIRLARERIRATFVIDRDDSINKVMRNVFARPKPVGPGNYLDEKLPCVSCRTFFLIRAVLCARQHGIGHILLCADPQQMLTMESNVRSIVKSFYCVFGRDLVTELFGEELEQILFADDVDLPRIVFPFVVEQDGYDPERIVSQLKEKDLYRSSSFETHCTLLPLLNYYSFRNWDCMFYKLNASSHVRALSRNGDYDRATYSLKFPRTMDVLYIEERLRTITLAIAAGAGDPDAHEEGLVDLFMRLAATEAAARYVARSFLDMRQVAAEMGISLAGEE
jgi:hypothetical protein